MTMETIFGDRELTREQEELFNKSRNFIYDFIDDNGLNTQQWYGFIANMLALAILDYEEFGEPEGLTLKEYFYIVAQNGIDNKLYTIYE